MEGLTLLTGRHPEAGFILRTFAHYTPRYVGGLRTRYAAYHQGTVWVG